MFAFGSIVLARLPFTDLTGAKRRPALTVSRDNDSQTDLVVCFTTSVVRGGPYTASIAATAVHTGRQRGNASDELGLDPPEGPLLGRNVVLLCLYDHSQIGLSYAHD